MSGNYPADVTDAHPHFNPPLCPHCGEEGMEPGTDCEACGEYIMSREDYEDMKADMEYDLRAEQEALDDYYD